MKKLVLLIAMVVGVIAFAQDKKIERKGLSSEERVEKMTKELDLTKEQQVKVKTLFDKQE